MLLHAHWIMHAGGVSRRGRNGRVSWKPCAAASLCRSPASATCQRGIYRRYKESCRTCQDSSGGPAFILVADLKSVWFLLLPAANQWFAQPALEGSVCFSLELHQPVSTCDDATNAKPWHHRCTMPYSMQHMHCCRCQATVHTCCSYLDIGLNARLGALLSSNAAISYCHIVKHVAAATAAAPTSTCCAVATKSASNPLGQWQMKTT